MEIKNQLQNSALDGFVASDGWLEKWKATYAIKEKRIVGEGGDVPEETRIDGRIFFGKHMECG